MSDSLQLRVVLHPLPDPLPPVGLQKGKADVIAGEHTDDSVIFDIEIGVKEGPGGRPDFKGPLVHGKRGERFLYVDWPTSRLKLHLSPVSRKSWSQDGISWKQVRAGQRLTATVDARGPRGGSAAGTAPAHWTSQPK